MAGPSHATMLSLHLLLPRRQGTFHKGSSVQLRNTMRTNDDEALRKAAYEGLRSIGPFVAGGLRDVVVVTQERPCRLPITPPSPSPPIAAEHFAEIVKVRNRLAKAAGYRNFYDMKLQQAEGFSLEVLFDGMLDGLEQQTRPIMEAGGPQPGALHRRGAAPRGVPWHRGPSATCLSPLVTRFGWPCLRRRPACAARKTLAEQKGSDALKPWNIGYSLAGDVEKVSTGRWQCEASDCLLPLIAPSPLHPSAACLEHELMLLAACCRRSWTLICPLKMPWMCGPARLLLWASATEEPR